MQTASQTTITRTLEACRHTGNVPIFQGSPGIGKTEEIKAYARFLEAQLRKTTPDIKVRAFILILSQMDPTEVAGIPMPSGDRVKYEPHPTLREAYEWTRDGNVAIIVFDELTTAPPAVQAATLTPFIDGRFGDYQLDLSRTLMVAACNPPAEAAAGYDLSAPTSNRLEWHTVEVDPASFADNYPAYWGSPPDLAARPIGGISAEAYARARAAFAAYVRKFPKALFAMPTDETKRSGPWPSPRSIDAAARNLALAYDRGLSHVDALEGMSGNIGQSDAMQVCDYLTDLDLPDPEWLLDDPSRFQMPARNDQAFATLAAVTAAVAANATPARWLAAWQILATVGRTRADMGAMAAEDLAAVRRTVRGLPNPPIEAVEIYEAILTAATTI